MLWHTAPSGSSSNRNPQRHPWQPRGMSQSTSSVSNRAERSCALEATLSSATKDTSPHAESSEKYRGKRRNQRRDRNGQHDEPRALTKIDWCQHGVDHGRAPRGGGTCGKGSEPAQGRHARGRRLYHLLITQGNHRRRARRGPCGAHAAEHRHKQRRTEDRRV